jgi:ribosomal protein S18 acetylase RimI-like enzyme
MTAEPASIGIRDYRAADRDAVVALARELQDHERAVFARMRHPQAIGPDYVEALLADCRKYGGGIIVAEIGGTLVGYAVVQTAVREESLDEEDYTFAYVADLVVTKPQRNSGVGGRLLAACEDIAVKSGARWLRISALAANEQALAFYRRFGFADHLVILEKPLGA